ncbi:MAG: aldo/keto reductase [Clostridiales bacterium]|nr:aldo/keto reductase [Clostridiales bacterium]
MEYRMIDDVKSSLLGFGCMRFPVDKDGGIDEQEATKMLDIAREAGVTYFDTAYPYHNKESEPFVGKYLSQFPRDSYYLASKLPCWEIHSLEDAKKMFALQLERLQKDYIDFYLLHALNLDRWNEMESYGVYDYLATLKAEGKIKHLGFSFHDNYEAFEKIITAKKWDFCQIQYNYMDTDEQAGDKGYLLAEKLGVPMVIMEPIKGGSLASLPDEVTKPFKEMAPDCSVASWALRWVGSHSNVKVILSGMSTYDQVMDNLKTFEKFEPLSEQELVAVKRVKEHLESRIKNGCTGCRYCMPCPKGVDIPQNFAIWNAYGKYMNVGGTKWEWNHEIEDSAKAKNCVGCGKCETLCPQKLSIRENLKNLQKELDELLTK